MQVGCVLTAGASQLWYVWHGLFDSILKHRVSLLPSLDFIFSSPGEKLGLILIGAMKSEYYSTLMHFLSLPPVPSRCFVQTSVHLLNHHPDATFSFLLRSLSFTPQPR